MKGMPGGMQGLMRQANQLQARMKKLQDELAEREYEVSTGGGAVTVKIKGDSEIRVLKISEEVVKSGDTEMVQDLVMAAVNEALRTAKKTHAEEMQKITGAAGFPGLF